MDMLTAFTNRQLLGMYLEVEALAEVVLPGPFARWVNRVRDKLEVQKAQNLKFNHSGEYHLLNATQRKKMEEDHEVLLQNISKVEKVDLPHFVLDLDRECKHWPFKPKQIRYLQELMN